MYVITTVATSSECRCNRIAPFDRLLVAPPGECLAAVRLGKIREVLGERPAADRTDARGVGDHSTGSLHPGTSSRCRLGS